MSKAEDLAIKYADNKLQMIDPELWQTRYSRYRKMGIRVMTGSDIEQAYQDGYEQAEKDLVLRWDDIGLIKKIYEEVCDMDFCPDIYGEVLKRFNEEKRNKV